MTNQFIIIRYKLIVFIIHNIFFTQNIFLYPKNLIHKIFSKIENLILYKDYVVNINLNSCTSLKIYLGKDISNSKKKF